MLPNIKIQFASGRLGKVAESPDGLVALVCGATAVGETFALETPYVVRSRADIAELGIASANNSRLYKHLIDFYTEAPEGAKIVVYGVDKTKTMTELLAADGAIRSLIEGQTGALRAVFVGLESSTTPQVTKGIDPDVLTALPKAQALAEAVTSELYAPLFIVLEGRHFTGKNLDDLSKQNYNRVGVLVGDTTPESKGAALGILAGRVATSPVQRNVGRVKDGAVKVAQAYLGGKPIEERSGLVSELHEKRYISLRRYVGRSGYFFADDNLATATTDDYAQIAARRVVDKAFRVAYSTCLDLVLAEHEVNDKGQLSELVVKGIEQSIESAINAQMTARGELSADADGSGCICQIDPTQNVVATSMLAISLAVRPHGYTHYITVELGFATQSPTKE